MLSAQCNRAKKAKAGLEDASHLGVRRFFKAVEYERHARKAFKLIIVSRYASQSAMLINDIQLSHRKPLLEFSIRTTCARSQKPTVVDTEHVRLSFCSTCQGPFMRIDLILIVFSPSDVPIGVVEVETTPSEFPGGLPSTFMRHFVLADCTCRRALYPRVKWTGCFLTRHAR